MQQSTHLLFASVLFAALLPVTVWGHGFSDYRADRDYRPYAGPAGGNHYRGALHMQTGRTGDGYYVRVYLDGLRPGDVQLFPGRNRLVMQIARGDRHGLYNRGARGVLRWQMRFRRQLRLPYDADWTRMTRSTKNGIMEIYIPRRRQYMPTDPSLTW